MKNNCVIKLEHDRLEALRDMYSEAIGGDCRDVDDLVFAHAKEMHHHLKLMAVKENSMNTLSLSAVECIALVRFWEPEPLTLTIWYAQTIQRCTDAANKYLVNQTSTLNRLN